MKYCRSFKKERKILHRKRVGYLGRSNLAWEPPFKTRYWRIYKKKRLKSRDDEEKEVSSYWLTLRKRHDTGNCHRKQYSVLFGELALEGATDLSWKRLRCCYYHHYNHHHHHHYWLQIRSSSSASSKQNGFCKCDVMGLNWYKKNPIFIPFYLFKFHFNIILPFMPTSSRWSLRLRFFHQ
jgi:hypothetical protein